MTDKRVGPVRLIDVAEQAGVSLTTASFAMSGRNGVSEEVAARIRAIAADLGYVPNMQARSLASGASSVVGLVVHDIADPYFAELAAAVASAADDIGLMVQICQSSRNLEHELREVGSLVASRVRAVILAGSGRLHAQRQSATYAELKRYQATGGRVAMIGRHHVGLDAVLSDNVEAGRILGDHFLDLGHRHIAIASGPADLATAHDRLQGVLGAVAAADIDPDDVPVARNTFTHGGGRAATAQLLEEHPETTGIIALNDAMAAGALSMLRELGHDVPGRVSVAGFDDVAVAADLGPGLTTIRFPLADMGRAALEIALKPTTTRARRKVFAGSLMARGSTASPS